jgi:organic hydroperoxide reductase OsmC/OhrA
MIEHHASISWISQGADFVAGTYSRGHTWRFDGGLVVRAAASPHNVPALHTDLGAVDPEEAFVASIASCHMLTFLYLAFRAGLDIAKYDDEAVGTMSVNEHGASWISSVDLRPQLAFAKTSTPPAPELIASLHHEAHAQCFIANSIKTVVRVVAAK